MSKDEIIVELEKLAKLGDAGEAHFKADELLLKFINDAEITKAFEAIHMYWD